MDKHVWWQFKMVFPRDWEELLTWKLTSLDITRVAINYLPEKPKDLQLTAWLPIIDWSDNQKESLETMITNLSETFATPHPHMSWSLVFDEDWNRKWKENWQPDRIGSHWLVVPSWSDSPSLSSRDTTIRLDPGSAFGTGNHPTTRLCLEALETFNIRNKRVADLGCGSGILCLGALALGATTVVGCDTDPLAVKATYMNITLNGYVDTLNFQVGLGSVDILTELLLDQPADVLVCNTLAPVITAVCPFFNQIIAPSGIGLLSGLLLEQVSTIANQLEVLNWQVTLVSTKDKWGLLEIHKPISVT